MLLMVRDTYVSATFRPFMLSVVLLNVVMMSVMAPKKYLLGSVLNLMLFLHKSVNLVKSCFNSPTNIGRQMLA